LEAAKQNGWGTSEFIENYGITDQGMLKEIVLEAAKQNGLYTSRFIKNCGITDQGALKEIALEAAKQDGRGTSEFIENYGITDEEALKEIIVVSLAQNFEALRFIEKYIAEKNWLIGVPEHLKIDHAAVEYIFDSLKKNNTKLKEKLHNLRNHEARQSALRMLVTNKEHLLVEQLIDPVDIAIKALEANGIMLSVNKTQRRDNFLQQQILITVSKLLESESLNQSDRKNLCMVMQELRTPDGKISTTLHLNGWQMIAAVINMNKDEKLKDIDSYQMLKGALERAFLETMEIENLENFADNYIKTFGQFRDKTAIFRYLGTLKRLPKDDCEKVLIDFRVYVEEVLSGNFQKNRYEGSAHLDELFAAEADLKEKWIEGISAEKTQLSSSASEFNFKELLRIKFQDKHISNEIIDEVGRYLNDDNLRIPKDMPNLQKYLILLAREGGKHLTRVQEELNNLEGETPELANDVEGWRKEFERGAAGLKEYTLVDTDDPCDFLLMGTEVPDSCQRVDGDGHLNKGLLGTMLDGKNRLLALKDPSGKIAGRAVLRLMNHEGKPALLIERIYPQTLGSAEVQALITFAKKRAYELNLKLYSVGLEGTPADVTLVSRGGRGAYQYVDSAGAPNPKPNGIFELQNLNILSS
ncbi:MAG: hypothetical protein KDK48_02865, partial [Chlamydiia bacterium]|nr:hypothetical protein [Chlamydiia bacterium]